MKEQCEDCKYRRWEQYGEEPPKPKITYYCCQQEFTSVGEFQAHQRANHPGEIR